MKLSLKKKEQIKSQIINSLANEKEIHKIIIFGSFVTSDSPNDIDIAVFQKSNETYLPLSMKYRRLLRELINTIPYDIMPVQPDAKG
jgi:uncharacterized protein